MREASNTFWVLAGFFLVAGIIYTVWTVSAGDPEPAGITALFFLVLMLAMVGFYLRYAASKLDADPADDPRGNIADSAGDYGFFSPGSGWPVLLGFSATLLFLGLAVGWWIFVIAVVLGVVALLGWTFEYFRGDVI